MKVYITGLGQVSSLGVNVEQAFTRLVENATGVVAKPEWSEYNGLNSLVAAPAPTYDSSVISRKARRSMSRMSEMATLATREALTQAGFDELDPWQNLDTQRCMICMGSTTGSPDAMEQHFRKLFERHGPEGQLSTTFFKVMNHSVPSNVAVALNFQGPLLSPSSACSTSSQALVLAWELIQAGVYDMVIAGGADELHYTSSSIFDIVQAASTGYNDRPEATPRPFDRQRDGLVVSEGAGVVILESEEHLARRGGRALAVFNGGAYVCDGLHMAHPQQPVMTSVMERALERSRVTKNSIDYVNAHATATLIGDVEEAKAIGQLFGRQTPVSSFKGHFGHSLAACAAIEVVHIVQMMTKGVTIATRNLQDPDPACSDIQLLQEPLPQGPAMVLSNNFAFGGMNTSLILSRVPEE